jgi:putative transposase
MSTTQGKVKRRTYPSDLTEGQWKKIYKLLPTPKSGEEQGGSPPCDLREILNALFYWAKEGCSWRGLPHDFPKWQSVYHYFNSWNKAGLWEKIKAVLVKRVRKSVPKKRAKREKNVPAPP